MAVMRANQRTNRPLPRSPEPSRWRTANFAVASRASALFGLTDSRGSVAWLPRRGNVTMRKIKCRIKAAFPAIARFEKLPHNLSVCGCQSRMEIGSDNDDG